ncbi:MAG TPA: hypothetical protein VGL20_12150 [Candidatus Dormibacteraeota bacterium]|jgi:hypothetical protein
MSVIAPAGGGFSLVTTTLVEADARRRALARHRLVHARTRSLCEDLAERLAWLQRPDDPDRVADVITMVGNETAALEVCIGRASTLALEPPQPPEAVLAALVDAIDAEMRLAELGDRKARRRAREMSAALACGISAMAKREET